MHSPTYNKNQIWQRSRSLGDNEVATSLGKGGSGEGEGEAGKALQKRILLVCTALMGHKDPQWGESPAPQEQGEIPGRTLGAQIPAPGLSCSEKHLFNWKRNPFLPEKNPFHFSTLKTRVWG